MTELRKAAEMALEAFEILDRRGGLGLNYHEYIGRKIKALRQALAQPEKQQYITKVLPDGTFTTEPVAPVDAVNISEERVDETDKFNHITVVCHKDHDKGYEDYVGKCLLCEVERLQKREWVGYTNEDRKRIVPMLVQSLINHDEKTMAGLLNAILIDIEQQLKEKNGG